MSLKITFILTDQTGRGAAPCDGATGDGAPGVLRCPCGSLLARRVPEGIELKCRRCKRTVVLALQLEGDVKAS